MVFFSVRVSTYLIKYQPFSDDDESYPIVDKDKTLLEYVKGTRTNGYYINPISKEKVEKTYMLVNNEPKEKFERTKETDRFRWIEKEEVNDLVNPKQYLIDCPSLLEEIKRNGKALKFGISFGGKSKPYIAVVFLNNLYNTLEMAISKGKKSEQYLAYTTELNDKNKLRELTLCIDGINRASVEELVELWEQKNRYKNIRESIE